MAGVERAQESGPTLPPASGRLLGLADAVGDAAIHPARAAARVWRGRLESAAEELMSAPEIARLVDRALAGPLPEELARSLARHNVVERVVRELADAGDLERLLDAALASPHAPELVDRLLASDAMRLALQRVVAGPEIREAMVSQSATLTDEVVGWIRSGAIGIDGRVARTVHRTVPAEPSPYGGVATRGVALAIDAAVVTAICVAVGAAAGLIASLVGGVHPHWLAATLLSIGEVLVAGGYFALFWSAAGQTPGMRLLHLRVRSGRADGRVTTGRAVVRTIGLGLAIVPFFLGFVPALFDRRRRALPDYVARTVVVYDD